jgi:two-component system chemotaxis response regulator CheB
VAEALTGALETPVTQRDLVVIGASAGGVDALQELVRHVPPEFPAAILVVLHVPSTGTSVLPQILARHGSLPAVFARDGDEVLRGQIYVAPADHHLLIQDGRIHLSQGPRENGHRPAIDPLFRSAARTAGPRCIGVVMSGLLDDGATGLRFIKGYGGATVVQDPKDAHFPSMPNAALALTKADRVVPAKAIGDALCELVDEGLERELGKNEPVVADGMIADPAGTARLLEAPPTGLTCPECGGALWEHDNGATVRFSCNVGHAYTLASLMEEQGRELETTLWSAVRSLDERADVLRRLARRTQGARTAIYVGRATDAEEHARSLRQMLATAGRLAVPTIESD